MSIIMPADELIDTMIIALRDADLDNLAACLDTTEELLNNLVARIDEQSQTADAITRRLSYMQIANSALTEFAARPDFAVELAQIAALANAARGAIARLLALLPLDSPLYAEIMQRRRAG
jgi:hypothetical protein